MCEEKKSKCLHSSQVRVRYYDTDLSKAVFFTNYIKWFDSIAIIDYLREKEIVWEKLLEDNMDAVVAAVSFNYLAPVFLDDIVNIVVEEVAIGTKSIRFSGAIYNHDTGDTVGNGSLVYVIVDYNSRRAVAIPATIRVKLES